MRIYYWNPWALFDELEGAMFGPAAGSSPWPVFDIEDSDDETVLTAELPGMTEDDVEVTVQAPMLIIRGERPARDGRYVRRDRFHGAFERRFRIGDVYDLDSIKASLAHGVLTIRLEKAAKAKPRRIKLGSGVLDKVKGLLAGDKDKEKETDARHAA
jgi:HSP20 family protein